MVKMGWCGFQEWEKKKKTKEKKKKWDFIDVFKFRW